MQWQFNLNPKADKTVREPMNINIQSSKESRKKIKYVTPDHRRRMGDLQKRKNNKMYGATKNNGSSYKEKNCELAKTDL